MSELKKLIREVNKMKPERVTFDWLVQNQPRDFDEYTLWLERSRSWRREQDQRWRKPFDALVFIGHVIIATCIWMLVVACVMALL